MKPTDVQSTLRSHTTTILRRIELLRVNEKPVSQRDSINQMHTVVIKCVELLEQPLEMSAVDMSDYLNHHIRNMLTPVYSTVQFVEFDHKHDFSQQELYSFQVIKHEIRTICDILQNLQQQHGTAGYQAVGVA